MKEGRSICTRQEVDNRADVELLQNGEPVPMVPFVKDIVSNIVHALAISLDDVDPNAEITIKIKKKD